MQFLVRSEIKIPLDMSKEEHDEMMTREIARGRELTEKGHVSAAWRVPGKRATITVFEVADATELHEIIIGLPVFPYVTIHSIEPLARHSTVATIEKQQQEEDGATKEAGT